MYRSIDRRADDRLKLQEPAGFGQAVNGGWSDIHGMKIRWGAGGTGHLL
jgi:hypothetical protein